MYLKIIAQKNRVVYTEFANKQSGIEYRLPQYRSAYLQIFLNFVAG